MASTPPDRSSHWPNVSPADRSAANRPMSRTDASPARLAGTRMVLRPNSISADPTRPPSMIW